MKSYQKMLLYCVLVLAFVPPAFAADEEAWNLIAELQDRAAQCANNDKDKANIADLLKKVNLFGTWKGTLNGKTATATFYKESNGAYKGKASLDESNYGPYAVKVCDDNGNYSGTVLGFKAKFEVQSKTKIKVYSPLNESETVILTRQ